MGDVPQFSRNPEGRYPAIWYQPGDKVTFRGQEQTILSVQLSHDQRSLCFTFDESSGEPYHVTDLDGQRIVVEPKVRTCLAPATKLHGLPRRVTETEEREPLAAGA